MFLGTLKKEPQARLLTLAETILMQNFIDFYFLRKGNQQNGNVKTLPRLSVLTKMD